MHSLARRSLPVLVVVTWGLLNPGVGRACGTPPDIVLEQVELAAEQVGGCTPDNARLEVDYRITHTSRTGFWLRIQANVQPKSWSPEAPDESSLISSKSEEQMPNTCFMWAIQGSAVSLPNAMEM